MKKAFRVLYESFYSRALYRDAATAWTGTGIGVLACLVLFGMLAVAVFLFAQRADYQDFKGSMLQQVPVGTIDKGELSIDRPTPYTITYGEHGPLILFDTSDETASLTIDDTLKKMTDAQVKMLVGKKSAFAIKDNSEYRVYRFSDFTEKSGAFHFDRELAAEIWNKAELFFVPFMFVLFYGFSLIYVIIQMLLYSLAGLLLNKILKGGFSYSTIQRMTVCALVPASVLGLALSMRGGDLPFLACLVITIGYLFFGIRSALKH